MNKWSGEPKPIAGIQQHKRLGQYEMTLMKQGIQLSRKRRRSSGVGIRQVSCLPNIRYRLAAISRYTASRRKPGMAIAT